MAPMNHALAVQAVAGFVDKWQAREPGMALAERFVAGGTRGVFRAWGALLHELRESAFELSDAQVRHAKSSWWAQELLAIGRGSPRHPLGSVLLNDAATPWTALASALIATVAVSDEPPLDGDHALQQMQPFAAAAAAVEAVLFGQADAGNAASAIAVHLLAQRLLVGRASDDAGRIPLHLQARHQIARQAIRDGGGDVAVRDWARELLTRMPVRIESDVGFRRMQWVHDRLLLRRLSVGSRHPSKPGLTALWQTWRAARGG